MVHPRRSKTQKNTAMVCMLFLEVIYLCCLLKIAQVCIGVSHFSPDVSVMGGVFQLLRQLHRSFKL